LLEPKIVPDVVSGFRFGLPKKLKDGKFWNSGAKVGDLKSVPRLPLSFESASGRRRAGAMRKVGLLPNRS
jgi:hypothetical protein